MSGILRAGIYGNYTASPPTIEIVFSGNAANVDLRQVILNAGWDGVTASTVNITIPPGVVVFSNSIAQPSLFLNGPFPGGMAINLLNQGRIIGKGGEGASAYASGGSVTLVAPTAGGLALQIAAAVNINNQGIIGGGGGGGGYGGYGTYYTSSSTYAVAQSAGGGGVGYGPGGVSIGGPGSAIPIRSGGNGANGDFYNPGAGGAGLYPGGKGGAGGSYGAAGASGTIGGTNYNSSTYPAGSGAAGGGAVTGNGFITWIATGAIYGSIT